MKKILSIVAVFISTASLAQQQINNGGLENWTIVATKPDYFCADRYPDHTGAYSMQKTGDSKSGSYAARIKNVKNGSNDPVHTGWMDYCEVPFQDNPLFLTFWYKFNRVGQTFDSAVAIVTFSAWDAASSTRLTTGGGVHYIPNPSGMYAKAVMPLTYWGAHDTVHIRFITSNTLPGTNGNEFYIDDIAFEYTNDVESVDADEQKIYPSPCTTTLVVENDKGQQAIVSNFAGQMLLSTSIVKGKNSIDVSSLPPGVYLLKLISDKGSCIKKFLKQ
ncbi:MAG TPA: T9SS type A sorting domain-containing protein [Flavipsychrobacter sp.]|mgnify:CR=1 FL=1|nr:T9SS type A sorting domain-containing protein [Flavipsychrobacter sp.]